MNAALISAKKFTYYYCVFHGSADCGLDHSLGIIDFSLAILTGKLSLNLLAVKIIN